MPSTTEQYFGPKRATVWKENRFDGDPHSPKSSPVGWPFWIPVVLTTIPFTVWFGIMVTRRSHDPIAWWEWIFAIPIGLFPAMVLGLVVQVLWKIGCAARQKRFGPLDGLFVLLLLALCVVPGWLYWRFDDGAVVGIFLLTCLCPLIGDYVRWRAKKREDLE
jgi:hypothetical protein